MTGRKWLGRVKFADDTCHEVWYLGPPNFRASLLRTRLCGRHAYMPTTEISFGRWTAVRRNKK